MGYFGRCLSNRSAVYVIDWQIKNEILVVCVADSENFWTPTEITADYAYFRLRDEGYTPQDITQWAQTIRDKTSGCSNVFVYFKHEEAGKGPEFASLLLKELGG